MNDEWSEIVTGYAYVQARLLRHPGWFIGMEDEVRNGPAFYLVVPIDYPPRARVTQFREPQIISFIVAMLSRLAASLLHKCSLICVEGVYHYRQLTASSRIGSHVPRDWASKLRDTRSGRD